MDPGRGRECSGTDIKQCFHPTGRRQHDGESPVTFFSVVGRHPCNDFLLQREMHVQDIRFLIKQVEERMQTRIARPDYRTALLQWIVEAARGLNMDAAEINASAAERKLIDKNLLDEAMKMLEQKVALTLSKDDPLSGQGVVLTSVNGRLAFNNQVRTRIQRHQREIHGLIHDVLFEN